MAHETHGGTNESHSGKTISSGGTVGKIFKFAEGVTKAGLAPAMVDGAHNIVSTLDVVVDPFLVSGAKPALGGKGSGGGEAHHS